MKYRGFDRKYDKGSVCTYRLINLASSNNNWNSSMRIDIANDFRLSYLCHTSGSVVHANSDSRGAGVRSIFMIF